MKYLLKLFLYFSILETQKIEAEPLSCNYSNDYYGDKKCLESKN